MKLQVGKTYMDGHGDIHTIVSHNKEELFGYKSDTEWYYSENGDYDYEPDQNSLLMEILTVDTLIPELAEAVHNQWMETKRSQGIHYRISETGEELMLPYHMLSEAAQLLDINSVKAVLNALTANGYIVAKPEASQWLKEA